LIQLSYIMNIDNKSPLLQSVSNTMNAQNMQTITAKPISGVMVPVVQSPQSITVLPTIQNQSLQQAVANQALAQQIISQVPNQTPQPIIGGVLKDIKVPSTAGHLPSVLRVLIDGCNITPVASVEYVPIAPGLGKTIIRTSKGTLNVIDECESQYVLRTNTNELMKVTLKTEMRPLSSVYSKIVEQYPTITPSQMLECLLTM